MTSKNDNIKFHVSKRDVSGKKVKKLRSEGLLPANIYGLKKDSENIIVEANAFQKLYTQQGDTGLVYLILEGGEEEPVLIDSIDYQAISGKPIHVSFKRVNLAEKLTAEVPVELVGENSVPDATVIAVRDALEVEALPADLPEKFEIDISVLEEIGQSVTIADLKFDRSKVEVVMAGDMEETSPMVILQEVKEEVEPEPVADDEAAEGEGAEAGESSEGDDAGEAADGESGGDESPSGDDSTGE